MSEHRLACAQLVAAPKKKSGAHGAVNGFDNLAVIERAD
jgi:hypothetical protein